MKTVDLLISVLSHSLTGKRPIVS